MQYPVGHPSFLCSACAKAYDAISRNGRLSMTQGADRDSVTKIIKQLDENDRYRRFVANLEQAKARRDEESTFVFDNLSCIKTKLNRFVSGSRRFSAKERELVTSFLVRWDLHLSGEKSGMRAAARTGTSAKTDGEAPLAPHSGESENRRNSKRRWGEFFRFRNRKQIFSVSSSNTVF